MSTLTVILYAVGIGSLGIALVFFVLGHKK